MDFGARSRDLRDLEALDGFVTACVIGPRRIPCAELLPLVWPVSTHWDSDEEKDRAFALTSRWYDDVVAREDAEPPESAPPFVHPLFELPPPDEGRDEVDEEYGRSWAIGFRQGMLLELAAWDAALARVPELAELLSDLAWLEFGGDPEDDTVVLSNDEALEIIDDLPETIRQISDTIRYVVLVPETIRRGPKIGRNDPCSCGSGKKYKKCCGATP